MLMAAMRAWNGDMSKYPPMTIVLKSKNMKRLSSTMHASFYTHKRRARILATASMQAPLDKSPV